MREEIIIGQQSMPQWRQWCQFPFAEHGKERSPGGCRALRNLRLFILKRSGFKIKSYFADRHEKTPVHKSSFQIKKYDLPPT